MGFLTRHVWIVSGVLAAAACIVFGVVFYPREPSLESKLDAVEGRYHAWELTSQGRELLMKGAPKQALARFEEALRLDNSLAYTNLLAGTVEFSEGDLKDAQAYFSRAAELDPRFEDGFNSRGVARYYAGDIEGAISDFTAALARNPEFLLAYINRGVARLKAGDQDGALKDLNHAIEQVEDPKNAPAAYVARGIVYAKQRQLDRAEADFSAVVDNAKAPEILSDALYNRAQVRRALGNATGADQDLARARELESAEQEPSVWATFPKVTTG